MIIPFTKMQGAGNDFVMIDETCHSFRLSPSHYRLLADRHFGVGADQILTVRLSPAEGIDFEYVIHNADGCEVEQCGNGARCFARFVHDTGLSNKDSIRVLTRAGVITPVLMPDGQVRVDMGPPIFDLPPQVFNPDGSVPVPCGSWQQWPLRLDHPGQETTIYVAVVSMGNPHAVLMVDDVDAAPVQVSGPLIEHHAWFLQRVNAGFMQVQDRCRIRLRVYERGTGETLACGSGACAAVVAGIRMGLLDTAVQVETRGGLLHIEWLGTDLSAYSSVFLTGSATVVFHGMIEMADSL